MSKSTIDRAALTEELLERYRPYTAQAGKAAFSVLAEELRERFPQAGGGDAMQSLLRRDFDGLDEDDLLTAAETMGIDISEYCVFFATDETSTRG